jgi:hypothetical protein
MNNVFVVGNNLFCFYPGATGEEKEDILDCLLLADLHASVAFDRRRDWGTLGLPSSAEDISRYALHRERVSGELIKYGRESLERIDF